MSGTIIQLIIMMISINFVEFWINFVEFIGQNEFRIRPSGRAAVVVLGDIGRSPRMQYHALSLAHQVRFFFFNKKINFLCFFLL